MGKALMAAGLLLGLAAHAAPDSVPVCTLAPGRPERLAVEPCRPAPPPRRRAVQALPWTLSRMPPAPPAPPATALPAPAPATVPVAPLPLNGCDSGGCRDAAGVRHESGVGNATLEHNGRLCNREGAWLQCY